MRTTEQLVLERNPQYGVQLQPIDFAAFVGACGTAGYTVEDATQVAAVLRDAGQAGPFHATPPFR